MSAAERMVGGQRRQGERENYALRPQQLDDIIGQQRVRENLRILIEAALARDEPVDHILFYGPPGLGKTSFAHVVANEMNCNIRITSGPSVERAGDLASILTHMRRNDILFIDEVHRLGHAVEEVLYPAMEEYALDIVIGKGPAAKNVRLNLPRFTVIGATTRLSLLASPCATDLVRVSGWTSTTRPPCNISSNARQYCWRSTSRQPVRRKSRAVPAAHRALHCVCCAGCEITPRCEQGESSHARSLLKPSV